MKILLLLIGLSVYISGCQNDELVNKQMNTFQSESKKLQETVQKQKSQIQALEELVKEQKQQLQPLYQVNSVLKEYPWLQKLRENTEWTKMTISRYEGDPIETTIDDPLFLRNMNNLLYFRSVGAVGFPSGYQSDVGEYIYKFYDDDQYYQIHVVNRGVIEAGRSELFFEVDPSIHMIGKAFMPKPDYVQHQGLIAKMADSGAVKRSDQYVQFNAFRVQSKIASLTVAKKLESKPIELGEIMETYTFYYYGIPLVMDVYQNDVHLYGDGEDEWYHLEEAGFILTVEAG